MSVTEKLDKLCEKHKAEIKAFEKEIKQGLAVALEFKEKYPSVARKNPDFEEIILMGYARGGLDATRDLKELVEAMSGSA